MSYKERYLKLKVTYQDRIKENETLTDKYEKTASEIKEIKDEISVLINALIKTAPQFGPDLSSDEPESIANQMVAEEEELDDTISAYNSARNNVKQEVFEISSIYPGAEEAPLPPKDSDLPVESDLKPKHAPYRYETEYKEREPIRLEKKPAPYSSQYISPQIQPTTHSGYLEDTHRSSIRSDKYEYKTDDSHHKYPPVYHQPYRSEVSRYPPNYPSAGYAYQERNPYSRGEKPFPREEVIYSQSHHYRSKPYPPVHSAPYPYPGEVYYEKVKRVEDVGHARYPEELRPHPGKVAYAPLPPNPYRPGPPIRHGDPYDHSRAFHNTRAPAHPSPRYHPYPQPVPTSGNEKFSPNLDPHSSGPHYSDAGLRVKPPFDYDKYQRGNDH